MSLTLDLQYASMISSRVRNYKRTSNGWNFSCPYCGDSHTNMSKARGYLYRKPDRLFYTCFNCNTSHHDMKQLLDVVDPNLAGQYQTEKFLERNQQRKPAEPVVKQPKFASKIDSSLRKVSSLPSFHRVKQFVEQRRIPSDKHYLLYYTPQWKTFANSIDAGVFVGFDPHSMADEPRLVIPLIRPDSSVAGYQGRALQQTDGPKYQTILTHEDNPKTFGMDRCDINYHVPVFEGPVDALFIENAIATCGGRLDVALERESIDKSRSIIVYDNEPRSKHTIAKIEKAIGNEYPVCIWPSSVKQTDVNDMVLSNQAPVDIQQTIYDNTYRGLDARLALARWKKI